MLKRYLFLWAVWTSGFASLLTLSLWMGPAAFADAYDDGLTAYQSKSYGRAVGYFQNALRQNNANVNALFYLGLSYAKLGQYENARSSFEMVLHAVPDSSELATKSRNNIQYLTRQQITQVSNSSKASAVMKAATASNGRENYLSYVISDGKIVHFATNKMPLKVYIANGYKIAGWQSNMKQAVVVAMRSWQSAGQGKISFTQTNNPANADIIVNWQKNFGDNILGVSPFQAVGNTIIRSDINLAVYYPNSDIPIPYGELITIATHEMGHAIGLKGHSPYNADIMYYARNRESNQSMSQRDINTIRMLYKLDADVQNSTQTSTAQTKQYYELYSKGVEAQKANRKAEAMQYYRAAMRLNSSLYEAKFNLGALLINQGNQSVRANNLPAAKRDFEEATALYSQILQNPQAPSGAKDNLEVARGNLNVVNKALTQP